MGYELDAIHSRGILTMTSMEIAMLTRKRHDHVLRDIKKMFKDLGKDLPIYGEMYRDAYGREQKMYKLDKELTLTLITGYNTQIRNKIIQRWNELEEDKWKNAMVAKDRPYEVVMREALMLADNRVKELEHQHVLDRPKVEFAKAVEGSVSSVKVEDWIKSVGSALRTPMGRTKAFSWLRENGFLQENNRPYQQWLDMNIFEVKQGLVETPKGALNTFTTLITGKGQLYLLEKLPKKEPNF